VAASGAVAESAIGRSSGHASLDEAARSALHRCRFVPALRNGRPVPTWTPVMYVWTLS
jgi:D-alanyl-D-alanine endopeptidase (penicillin-binding protein 7)